MASGSRHRRRDRRRCKNAPKALQGRTQERAREGEREGCGEPLPQGHWRRPRIRHAAIFWLKTRAGWRETNVHEIGGLNNRPIEIDVLVPSAHERLQQRLAVVR